MLTGLAVTHQNAQRTSKNFTTCERNPIEQDWSLRMTLFTAVGFQI